MTCSADVAGVSSDRRPELSRPSHRKQRQSKPRARLASLDNAVESLLQATANCRIQPTQTPATCFRTWLDTSLGTEGPAAVQRFAPRACLDRLAGQPIPLSIAHLFLLSGSQMSAAPRRM